MYIPFKQSIKKTFPQSFQKLRAFKDQCVIEGNTLKQVGVTRILKQFFCAPQKWKTELPLQRIRKLHVNETSLEDLKASGASLKQGGHAVYFSPESINKTSLKNIMDYLPCDAGIKIVERLGGIDTPYAASDKTCLSHTYMSPSHKELMLVHGIFSSMGLGPRLYDLVEIGFENGDVHVAYMIQHIQGDACADKKKCELFVGKIKKLEKSQLLKLINWNGYKDMDFDCPSCNGNLICESESGQLKYVDLQNFALDNYYNYLKDIAIQASKNSHFGQKSYLLGGEYLYQEVPGLNLGAKRSPAVRFDTFKKLLQKSGLSLEDKFVMDVGCNMGLMGAQYLKDGAAWLHGFDMPNVVGSTEKILTAIGCTRFSTTGLTMSEDVSLIQRLPQNLKDRLEGCVISYLAIRGHIGWIKELGEISWDFMLYEGHQEEDAIMNHNFISELQKLKGCVVLEEGWISDANSTPRYIAIIKSELST